MALNEHAADCAAIGDDRLVDKVEVSFVDGSARTMLQLNLRAAADKRFTGPVNLVEQRYETLSRDFRQGFADWLAQHLAIADQRTVGLIDQCGTDAWDRWSRR